MDTKKNGWLLKVPTLALVLLITGEARAQFLSENGLQKLRELAANKGLNIKENLDTVGKLRRGEMPPQPKDGGCVTRQSQSAIADFLQRRHKFAELAEYARLVYERENLQNAIQQAHLAPARRQFEDVYVDNATSLAYMLVEQPGIGGKTDVTIVFEGSTYKHNRAETINKFLRADVAQLVSKTTPEMFQGAEQVYLTTLRKYPKSIATITLTGHSLGGALASYVGAKYNVPTVTFNSARLSQSTVNDAARERPEILDNGMRGVNNIIHISASTDTAHFMGIPGQATFLPGSSFVLRVSGDDVTGHGMGALSNALAALDASPPSSHALCANYYGNDAAWSALKSNVKADPQ